MFTFFTVLAVHWPGKREEEGSRKEDKTGEKGKKKERKGTCRGGKI